MKIRKEGEVGGSLRRASPCRCISSTTAFQRGPGDEFGDDAGASLESLSGGERSLALACFLLSVWNYQPPPFRLMDEWDLFLDDLSRAAVERMLQAHCRVSGCQHIFASPRPPGHLEEGEERLFLIQRGLEK